MKLDVRSYSGNINKPNTRRKINELMEKYKMIDVWWVLYPKKRKYAWRNFNTTKQGHLDFFQRVLYRKLTVQEWIVVIDLVTLLLRDNWKQKHSKGKNPFRKFNNSLLRDRTYVDEIRKSILKVFLVCLIHLYILERKIFQVCYLWSTPRRHLIALRGSFRRRH